MSLRHQRCFPSPSIPCLCLSFFISSFFLSPILTSSLPSLVQSLYSHANNTRLLHTSQQDISERVHLRLQLLWPAVLPAASLSSLLLRHQRESLSTASPRGKSSRAETVVCSFLHYFLLTVGGTVASPSQQSLRSVLPLWCESHENKAARGVMSSSNGDGFLF